MAFYRDGKKIYFLIICFFILNYIITLSNDIKIIGYTDIRGRFDYALSSASDVDNIKKFAILIYSDEYGI